MRSSGIGGQAVIEGVMMKNGSRYAVAIRKPDGKIVVDTQDSSGAKKNPVLALPIVRGVAAFVESLSIGMKTLTYSASFYEEEAEEASALEKKLDKVTKGHAEGILNAVTLIISVVLAIGIFVALPMVLAGFLSAKIQSDTVLALLEGVFRLLIFIGYIVLISQLKDIRRLFMYHGAEHKSINCIESGLPLTVANVKKQSREHKRCGTSFLLTVMVISVIFFIFIRVDNAALRFAVRLLLIPVIAGISYEFIRLAGRSDSGLVNFLSRPGMWLQALTTREPEEDMIEVAMASVEAVFDWQAFIAKEQQRNSEKGRRNRVKLAPVEDDEEELQLAAATGKTEAAASGKTASKAVKADVRKKFDREFDEEEIQKRKQNGKGNKTSGEAANQLSEKEQVPVKKVSEEEDDVLRALDMYFDFSGSGNMKKNTGNTNKKKK